MAVSRIGVFGEITTQEKALIEVDKFLSNDDVMLKQLKKLNGILIKIAASDERYAAEKNTLKGYVVGQPYKHHKLLSGYLKKWAVDNHYKLNEKGKITKVEDALSPALFFDILAAKTLFKDKAFGGSSHGEWTHFLQWWCITEAYNDKEITLPIHPHEIFEWLGKEKNRDLWFRVFEDPNSQEQRDFRNVLQFNNFLLSEEASRELPILHQLISGRSMIRDIRKGRF